MSSVSTQYQMAQRGPLFKLEPHAVSRDVPRTTGLRALAVGDLLRDRLHPCLLYRVVRVGACRDCLAHVTVFDEQQRTERDSILPFLARGYEHADGAGIEVRP